MLTSVSYLHSSDTYRSLEFARLVLLMGRRMRGRWRVCHDLGEVERDLNTSGLAL